MGVIGHGAATPREDIGTLFRDISGVVPVGTKIAPMVDVGSIAGRYTKIDYSNYAPDGVNDRRADGADFASGLFSGTPAYWLCESHGRAEVRDRKIIDATPGGEQSLVQWMRDQMLLAHAQRVTALMDAGSYSAAATALWSATSGTAIREDIQIGIQSVIDNTYGVSPMLGCAGSYKIRDALNRAPELTGIIGGASDVPINYADTFLRGLGIDQVYWDTRGVLTGTVFYIFGIDPAPVGLDTYRGALATPHWVGGDESGTEDFDVRRKYFVEIYLDEILVADEALYRVTGVLS